jgi:hypothetical protein
MKYLKLFEEFVVTKPKPKEEINLSDKTIDDVLKDDFLEDEENIEDLVTQDKMGVYQIKNWRVY